VVLLALGPLGGAGCSSTFAAAPPPDTGSDCHASPEQCPSGETCWPTNAGTFACLPSAPTGTFGVACEEVTGTPTCADGMICNATNATGTGTCTYYCGGGAKPCPGGYSCEAAHLLGEGGPTIDLCRISGQAAPDGGSEAYDAAG
jgi:hypothetical protein